MTVRVVILTPTITVGNDFNPSDTDLATNGWSLFDRMYVYGSNFCTCGARETVQTMGRPRRLVDNVAYYYLDIRPSAPLVVPIGTGESIAKTTSAFLEQRTKISHIIREVIVRGTNLVPGSLYSYEVPDWLTLVFVNDAHQRYMGAYHYRECFETYLSISGYDVAGLARENEAPLTYEQLIDESEPIGDSKITDRYGQIPLLEHINPESIVPNYREMDRFRLQEGASLVARLITYQRELGIPLTPEIKEAWDKYTFLRFIRQSAPIEVQERLWKVYVNPKTRHRIDLVFRLKVEGREFLEHRMAHDSLPQVKPQEANRLMRYYILANILHILSIDPRNLGRTSSFCIDQFAAICTWFTEDRHSQMVKPLLHLSQSHPGPFSNLKEWVLYFRSLMKLLLGVGVDAHQTRSSSVAPRVYSGSGFLLPIADFDYFCS